MIKNQNSEQQKIIYKIVEKLTRESDLAEYLEIFGELAGEVVAETFWYAVVENMTWQTFNISCPKLYLEVVVHSDPSLIFLIRNTNSVLRETQKELSEGFRAAVKEANGDFKRFDEIFCEQWFPVFSCKGKLDVLSTLFLWAAKKHDVNVVKQLLESGIQPFADWKEIAWRRVGTWTSKWIPLHYAAFNGDRSMCTLLIYHNASLTAKDGDGRNQLHYALIARSHEIVCVLLSAEGGAGLLDATYYYREGVFSYAVYHSVLANMIVWMLSLCIQPESYFGELEDPSMYLLECSRMGYVDLIQKLLDGGADPFKGDDEGKTALHYAAEGEDHNVAFYIIRNLLVDKKRVSPNWEKISAADKYGRSMLHVAAFLEQHQLCCRLLENTRNLRDTKDRDGQNAIHHAVAGPHDTCYILDELRGTLPSVAVFSQTTPLHVAAARGNQKMMKGLLQWLPAEERKNYVGATDVLGQIALHKAASRGHCKVVEFLLQKEAHPLKEHDSDSQIALHFAAQADDENAMKIAELLLNKCESEKQKSLFASAVGNRFPNSFLLEEYLKQTKNKIGETLVPENSLEVAATLGDIDMMMESLTKGTMECVTKGANFALIPNEQWRASLSEEEKNAQDGRRTVAIGLVALFLNPFVNSPVTVGISGEWRMGKSSVML